MTTRSEVPGTLSSGDLDPLWISQGVAMSLLAMTLFGFTFSGREAAIIGVIVVAIVLIGWWIMRRR